MGVLYEYPSKIVNGVVPLHWARNGLPAHAGFIRTIARALGTVTARSGARIPGKWIPSSVVRNSASDLCLWRARYTPRPNAAVLACVVGLYPTDDLTGSPAWYLKIDGVAATPVGRSSADVIHNRRCAAGGGLTLDDQFDQTEYYAITPGGTPISVELWTKAKCRVRSWNLWEVDRESLTIGSDSVVDSSLIAPMLPITTTVVGNLATVAENVWKHYRKTILNWNVDDPATPVDVTSTTSTNIWDGATGIGAGAYVPAWSETVDSESGGSGVGVDIWVYAERTSGSGSIVVEFTDTDSTLTLSVTGAAGYVSGVGTIYSIRNNAIYVSARASDGSTTGKIWAVGMDCHN